MQRLLKVLCFESGMRLNHLVLIETANSASQLIKKQKEKQSKFHIFRILGQRLAILC